MSPPSANDIISPAPRWTWRSVGFALLATAGLFMLPPMMERLSQPEMEPMSIRELERVELPPPRKPPPPPREREMEEAVPDMELPQPKLERAAPEPPPLRLPVELRPSLGEVKGNFQSDFAVRGEGLGAGISNPVFEISDLDRPPSPVARMRPQYPPRARLRRTEGAVTVEFVVGEGGEVIDVTVVESRPAGVFDRAVERAVRSWKFQPGEKAGRAVSARVRQRIEFTLE